MSRSVVPVILSGGSGTRLWPLSRERRPKQLLPLVSERTLLQETLLRLDGLGDLLRPPIVVCNEAHRFLVAEQLRQIDAAPQAIVLEPVGRNTAPAVAVAAMLAGTAYAARTMSVREIARDSANESVLTHQDDPLLLVLPADHVVLDPAAFVQAVRVACNVADAGALVTFGVVPDKAETGYGYLAKGAPGSDEKTWFHLDEFVEKPDRATAERYLSSGNYLWNSGMFVFRAGRYLEELGRHAPEMLRACIGAVETAAVDQDFTRIGASFAECPSDSIDYAVMEKTSLAALVPLDAGWNDIGSWSALHDVSRKDDWGNVSRGDVLMHGCRNSYVASAGRLVAAVGLDDQIVVATDDAVLVMARGASQDVKQIVETLRAEGRRELDSWDGDT